jgi:hypothetical protein
VRARSRGAVGDRGSAGASPSLDADVAKLEARERRKKKGKKKRGK